MDTSHKNQICRHQFQAFLDSSSAKAKAFFPLKDLNHVIADQCNIIININSTDFCILIFLSSKRQRLIMRLEWKLYTKVQKEVQSAYRTIKAVLTELLQSHASCHAWRFVEDSMYLLKKDNNSYQEKTAEKKIIVKVTNDRGLYRVDYCKK